ncbi:ATP-dependent RNA helicase dbp10 [Ascosphaera atra]|nr:ATP-dependent RNA helicase dbp10 [Ascosphaera atra]
MVSPTRTPPAASYAGFDISKGLLGGNGDDESGVEVDEGLQENRNEIRKQNAGCLDFLDAVNDAKGDEREDDTAFVVAIQAQANRKASNHRGRIVKKSGGFQAMGLNTTLLNAIARKGFSVPTPIQRKTIPVVLDDRDVVGMARTGSGKTAAFVIPMIEKLKSHSTKVGSRALILSPSRELAMQTLKVVRELGRGTDLTSVLLVGGDSMENQFGFMTRNPDVIIATPGRFLHLKVEMELDLSSIKYVVFDEADRLFEMGFAAQLTEILYSLPISRQTLLFSATLPRSLVEFARAGLQEPSLIRLDTESKVSPDLQNAFFTVKSAEKEGALLYILHEVINIPTGETEAAAFRRLDAKRRRRTSKKRKRSEFIGRTSHETPTDHSTIVFVATKHHVEYITSVLREFGFAVSYAYGSLDQTARKIEVQNFRSGLTHVFVVTDVAARGIDIPVLANVVNYDFPTQPKIFVHRVGRTARAGRRGWSYSLVRDIDAPYLLDLQLFLGKPLIVGSANDLPSPTYTDEVVVGGLARDAVSRYAEWVSKLIEDSVNVEAQRGIAAKGEKLYNKTRNAASGESARRAKSIVESDGWMSLHPLFSDEAGEDENRRDKMLARISCFKPQETVFEARSNKNGKNESKEVVDLMKRIRSRFDKQKEKKKAASVGREIAIGSVNEDNRQMNSKHTVASLGANCNNRRVGGVSMASDMEYEVTLPSSLENDKPAKIGRSYALDIPAKVPESTVVSYQNPEYFMSYTPSVLNTAEDRAYGVHSGANVNFAEASRCATMDLTGDESAPRAFGDPRSQLRWDKRHKKYVSRLNDEDGSKGGLVVRGESGVKIAASFRSGKYDAWRKAKRISRLPRVGETESQSINAFGGRHFGRSLSHTKRAPKGPGMFGWDHRKRGNNTEPGGSLNQGSGFQTGPSVDINKGATTSFPRPRNELKSVDNIRKAQTLKERRREKNSRRSRKGAN